MLSQTATSLHLASSTAALKAPSPAATSESAARSAREALFSMGLKDAAGLFTLILADLFSFDIDGDVLLFSFDVDDVVTICQCSTAHPHMPIASSYGHLDSSGMHPAAVLR